MSYLKFNQAELINLEYSLQREVVAANKNGSYVNQTIVCCNTRKYHGMFITPISEFDRKKYLLLSSLDETLIQHQREFNLGIHYYGDVYEPRGHKYIINCEFKKTLAITYRVGGMLFKKELLLDDDSDNLFIKYTLLEAHSKTYLRLKPFLAFRSIHDLTQENDVANTNYLEIDNGAAYKLYDKFPTLYIQTNVKNDYVHDPVWNKGIVYKEEKRRGFSNKEDLLVPGYFELPISKGESIIVSVSTKKVATRSITKKYNKVYDLHIERDDYESCLKKAASQFINKYGKKQDIIMGYAWMGKGLRETFQILPGLTIFNNGDEETFKNILNCTLKDYKDRLIQGSRKPDSSLWAFWTLQQYIRYCGREEEIWKDYSLRYRKMLATFLDSSRMGVRLDDNGLLWVKMNRVALTWMNAYYANGDPVTQRGGYDVEINCLWYNAVCFTIDMLTKYGRNKDLVLKLLSVKEKFENNFEKIFWNEDKKCLYDYVDEKGPNKFVRPNQLSAVALEYSPLSEEKQARILKIIKKELLTPKGIRTLSPNNLLYRGIYDGNQSQRDDAYHQGSTRVWLLGFYIDASLKLFGKSFVSEGERLVNAFEEDLTVHGVGTVAELYDGNPPYHPHGAVSSATSVSELLRAMYLLNQTKEK